jgi:hypothetical protein
MYFWDIRYMYGTLMGKDTYSDYKAKVDVMFDKTGGGSLPIATLEHNSDFRGLFLQQQGVMVPEPSTYMMFGLGLVVLVMAVRKK